MAKPSAHPCVSVLVLAVLLSLSLGVAASPPNVLFVVVDDLQPSLSTYGVPTISPNVDRLHHMGTQFQRAYVSVAVCAPSRTAFLTGLRWVVGQPRYGKKGDVSLISVLWWCSFLKDRIPPKSGPLGPTFGTRAVARGCKSQHSRSCFARPGW